MFGLAYGGAVSDYVIAVLFFSTIIRSLLTEILGQYAQKISVSEKMIMHIPDTMSFETAAGVPEVSYNQSPFCNTQNKANLLPRPSLLPSKPFTSSAA